MGKRLQSHSFSGHWWECDPGWLGLMAAQWSAVPLQSLLSSQTVQSYFLENIEH